jgi:hypothetical protein
LHFPNNSEVIASLEFVALLFGKHAFYPTKRCELESSSSIFGTLLPGYFSIELCIVTDLRPQLLRRNYL